MAAKPWNRLTYYEILEVDPGVSLEHLRTAFHGFAQRYHPDRHLGRSAPEQAHWAAVYRSGAEAYRVLAEPHLRRAYDAALAEGQQHERAARTSRRPSRAPAGAPSNLPARARPFAAQAELAKRAGDLRAARLHLKLALQHAAGHEPLVRQLREVEERIESEDD